MFQVYLRLVENLKLTSGLTLRCACIFLREGFRIYVFNLFISISILRLATDQRQPFSRQLQNKVKVFG